MAKVYIYKSIILVLLILLVFSGCDISEQAKGENDRAINNNPVYDSNTVNLPSENVKMQLDVTDKYANEKKAELQVQENQDVWEREFVCNFGPRSFDVSFKPTADNDVIIFQRSMFDTDGEKVLDENKKALLFFKNSVIENGNDVFSNIILKDEDRNSFESYPRPSYSEGIKTKDGNNIKWIRGIASDGNVLFVKGKQDLSDMNPKLVDQILVGYDTFQYPEGYGSKIPFNYYNLPVVFSKTDKENHVASQKVYLYYDPYWKIDFSKADMVNGYVFMYFRMGNIVAIKEGKVFVYFNGLNKVFRIDNEGMPKTNDKKLVVADFKDYKNIFMNTMEHFNLDLNSLGQGVTVSPCNIYMDGNGSQIPMDKINSTKISHILLDYDYFGEQLAQKFSINTNDDDTNKLKSKFNGLNYCIKNYKKLEEIFNSKK